MGTDAKGWLSDRPRVEAWLDEHPLLAGRVIVLGHVSEDDLPAVTRGSATLVSSSEWEGFGLNADDRDHPGHARRRWHLAAEDEHSDHDRYDGHDLGASTAEFGGKRQSGRSWKPGFDVRADACNELGDVDGHIDGELHDHRDGPYRGRSGAPATDSGRDRRLDAEHLRRYDVGSGDDPDCCRGVLPGALDLPDLVGDRCGVARSVSRPDWGDWGDWGYWVNGCYWGDWSYRPYGSRRGRCGSGDNHVIERVVADPCGR